jgi:hypothetical protein
MANPKFSHLSQMTQERWISGHLYYHQRLDPVVHDFVHPLAVSLVRAGKVDGFFFVRYSLGGPHVRLRLRVISGACEHALEAMQHAARCFLESAPSTRSLDEGVIRQTNQSILAFDPSETDNSVYPDNSFFVMPFHPEIQRYGGPSLLRLSLNFFTLSSVAAIEFLLRYGAMSRSAQLAQAYLLLLQQALGFATNEEELANLLSYGVDSWGFGPPKILDKGDKVFRDQIDMFLQLFSQSISYAHSLKAENRSLGQSSYFIVVGARRLSTAIKNTDRLTRARIGGSQLHMTASRLGLSNVEEVYISRLLAATIHEVLNTGKENFSWLKENAETVEPIEELLPSALAALSDVHAGVPRQSRGTPL